VFQQTVLFTVEEPQDIMDKLMEYLQEQKCDVVESGKKYKV